MTTSRYSTLFRKYDHKTDLPSVDRRKQQQLIKVEQNPKHLFFLNVTLTIFYRLARLDVVNHVWSHSHLHLAAFYGWVDIIKALLNLGSNPDVQDSKGLTALHVACASVEEDTAEIVEVLLKNGADPNLKADATGFAPIHHLIEASCNAAEPWDCNGKLEVLLKGGDDIDSRDKHGRAPINLSSCIPWCNGVFALLHKRGARLDLIDNMRRSILHYAAMYGDLDHVSYLRKHGLTEPDPDGKDINNQTPLDLLLWRVNTKQKKLGKNMKRSTGEVIKAFNSLIKEIRIHRWQDGHGTSYQDDSSCWRQVKPTNHLTPRGNRINLPIRPKPTLTSPPSIEQEMHVKERRAYYA
ncbi:hypothetical protein FCIRC_12532 [Fusarium circinatum]|uniref:Ankyrin repeat protein n=1 Tax=Fusarium circinatum TaxID=48490 RepID=A0A8H5WI59_FUSCI|nr:hypothetical protein FCIRC_12532 [Fusarium circinatum]